MTTLLAPSPVRLDRPTPTVWGLTPQQIHDRFWAAYGVQVIRRGAFTSLEPRAELYLLCEPTTLLVMELAQALKVYSWLEPDLLRVRIQSTRPIEYREVVVADSQQRVVRIERIYGETLHALTRVALTTDAEIARRWSEDDESMGAWRRLSADVPRNRRPAVGVPGQAFDGSDPHDTMRYMKQLVECWERPDATLARAHRLTKLAWADRSTDVPESAQVIGPVWIGHGRNVEPGSCVVGPTILWDAPDVRPHAEELDWSRIGLSPAPRVPGVGDTGPGNRSRGKRAFDIAFSLAVLLLTLPLYPIIALAILIEDGRPIFFGHRRETLRGTQFSCWKFRSMRNDAEDIKSELQSENEADGPQFFLDPSKDPRLTRVGRFIRKWQLDELPQFVNVLLGHMSVVGPRPSPRKENQYCPGWREARLSMRPGLTGLWQVRRTRAPGLDFQEWIRFDLLYAESRSWRLDLWIIWMTIQMVMPWSQVDWWKRRRSAVATGAPAPSTDSAASSR